MSDLIVLLLLTALCSILVGCAATSPPPDNAGPIAEGSNRNFTYTLATSASAASVWALWTNVAEWPAWDQELKAATLEGVFREGAEGSLDPLAGPSARFVIEDVEPGEAYTLATRLPLGWLRVRRVLGRTDDGRVTFTHTVTFSGLGGRALARRLGPQFRKALPVAMEQLRALAEAQPEAPGRP
ncbi:MAG: SRPBCC family protein [Bacteroidota bacterium]